MKVAAQFTGTNAGTEIESELEINGTSFGGPRLATSVSAGSFIFAGTIPVIFPPGTQSIIIKIGQPGGPGTASAVFASMIINRVG